MSRVGVAACKALNRIFPLPPHPFNMRLAGGKTYAEWQFEKGAETIRFYLRFADADAMFRGKDVLDIGCGAAGKTVYYASLGARSIVGLEILERYRAEAESLAASKGCADRFAFVVGDAAAMPFADARFDTIVMNDAMEHVAEPLAVLRECARVLKPGGRLYLNFPPYDHPFGAHLSDRIGIPWAHRLFSERTLVQAYKDLTAGLPDAEERVSLRIGPDGRGGERFTYINRMTIRRFRKILAESGMSVAHYREEPLRRVLAPLAKLPGLREFFVKMVVCILDGGPRNG
jgi:SAM-dependent methyltransferase